VQKRFTADKDGPRDERIWRRGRPPGQKIPRVVVWDLKQAARSMCKEALLFIQATMRNEAINHDTRLRAAQILLERGYGRPEVQVEVDMTHKFAVVPAVLSREEWLATKGAGYEAHAMEQEMEAVEKAAKRIGESPTGVAGHSAKGPPMLELHESQPRRLPTKQAWDRRAG
jgi:hypothetical protein